MKEKGLIALVAILVISAVTIFISVSASLLGISEAQIGVKKQNTEISRYLATSCAEEALLKLRDNFTGYAGNETVPVDGKTCHIRLIVGDATKTVEVEATNEGHTRRIKFLVSKPASRLVIQSWQEVPDF